MRPMTFWRNALFVCVPACFLLGGCSRPQSAADFSPKLSGAYSVEAEMEYGSGQSAVLTVTRYDKGVWEAAFSEPESLAGVVLAFDGNAVSASYKGLAFSVPKSALPAKNMLVPVTDALDAAAVSPPLSYTQQEDGSFSCSVDTESGTCTLTFSETGEPAAAEIPSQPVTLRFSAYTLLTAPETTAAQTEETVPQTGTEATPLTIE